MAALLQYLKHWFQSLFGTVKQEFDGTVKKEEVVEKDVVKPIATESVVESNVEYKKPHRTSKLTMAKARAIRADRHIKTIKELATEYSVSTDTIKRILDNKTYKEC